MLNLALVVLSLTTAAPSADVTQAIAKIARAHGGEAALQQARFLRLRGKLFARKHDNHEAPFEQLYRYPMQLGVINEYGAGNREVRLLKESRGWRQGEEVHGMPLLGMQLQAARMGAPLSLLEQRDRVTRAADIERDGNRYMVVELQVNAALQLRLEARRDSGIIERAIGTIHTPHADIQFITDYSDYRRVDGVLFAFEEARTIMGRPVARTVIEEIEILRKDPGPDFKI